MLRLLSWNHFTTHPSLKVEKGWAHGDVGLHVVDYWIVWLQVATLYVLYGRKNGTNWTMRIPVVEVNSLVWISKSSIWCDTFREILGVDVDIFWKDIVPFLHYLSVLKFITDHQCTRNDTKPSLPGPSMLHQFPKRCHCLGKFQGASRQTLVSSCRALVGHSWASFARGCHCQLQGNLRRQSSQANVT